MNVSMEVGYSGRRQLICWTSREKVIGSHNGSPTQQLIDGSLVEREVNSKQVSLEATSIPWPSIESARGTGSWKRCIPITLRHMEEMRQWKLQSSYRGARPIRCDVFVLMGNSMIHPAIVKA
jgi:hypothetical protein